MTREITETELDVLEMLYITPPHIRTQPESIKHMSYDEVDTILYTLGSLGLAIRTFPRTWNITDAGRAKLEGERG